MHMVLFVPSTATYCRHRGSICFKIGIVEYVCNKLTLYMHVKKFFTQPKYLTCAYNSESETVSNMCAENTNINNVFFRALELSTD